MIKNLLFLIFAFPLQAFAQSSMIINYKNGDIKTINIDDIDNISFRQGNAEDDTNNSNNSFVLIENFVAQNCINSPNSEIFIDEFIANHKDDKHHYIAVNLYAGPLSMSTEKVPYGLGNEIAEYYNQHFNILSWPATLFNTHPLDNNGLIEPVYYTDLEKITGSLPNFDLELNSSFDQKDRTLSVSVNVRSENKPANHKLFVWLTEDNVAAFQSLPDGTRDMNFIHNHVFRDALTDINGEDFSSGSWNCTYKVPVGFGAAESNDKYHVKAENTHIVAFVVDNEGNVIAATEK